MGGRPRESESGKTAALSLRISSDLRSRLEAFKYAVIKVLDGIRPTGACEAPEVPDAYKFSGPTPEDTTDRLIYGGQFFDTPENRGRDVATWLLTDLFRNKESDLKEMKFLVHVWGQDEIDHLEKSYYTLERAFRALQY